MTAAFAAADLGATSGRVVLGTVGPRTLDLTECHRFANTPVQLPGGLHWDILGLYRDVLTGLREAARGAARIASVGVDSWAVDYGLLDADQALIGNPRHYRDPRTDPVAEEVRHRIGAAELYRMTGLQHLSFNTVYQLAAERPAALCHAGRLLLIPDLLTHWLTGTIGAEATNASTTGLFDVRTGTWSAPVLTALAIRPELLPPLHRPGHAAGTLLPHVAAFTTLPGTTPVTAVASHDTASAVVALPATGEDFAYISCGTWSLAGLELAAPVLTEAARTANFTNELGIDDTTRFLRNIMGLWLLSESLRAWEGAGLPAELPALLAQAARAKPFGALVNPDAPQFLAPGDIPGRIAAYCADSGQSPPGTQGAVVRCILESLALAHRHTLRQAAELAGRDIRTVHLVGGGSRNTLLCQLTADATGLPVVAGPAEATALGNILVQARTHGLVHDRAEMRRLVADTQQLRHFVPRGDERAWARAAARVGLC